MGKLVCLLFTFVLLDTTYGQKDEFVVTLEDGPIAGIHKTSYYGRGYLSFEGIPYVAPPIGINRFKDPQPVDRWNHLLVANQTYTCPQLGYTGPYGTEDCLYLNVYTPLLRPNGTEKLDVVVHIHGGAFMMGNGYDFCGPSKIMDRDIVYVTFNYRLGPIGFLATEDNTFSGNYGLKDQVMALRWVQKYIKLFGGNPDSVTLIGASAGGACVHLHFFKQNTTEVLFHRAWAESGSALDPWALRERTRSEGAQLIKTLGCDHAQVDECMRNKSANDIIGSLVSFYRDGNLIPVAPFGPVIEEQSEKNPNPFMVRHPYVQLKDGHTLNIPFIVSQATHEGMIPAIVFYHRIEELNKKWNTMLPFMLEFYDVDEEIQNQISNKIRNVYFKNETLSRGNFDSLVKVCSERMFHMGAEISAKLGARLSSANTYFMLFGYDGANKFLQKVFNATDLDGAIHTAEAVYLYDTKFPLSATPIKLNQEEERMQEIMLDFLASFAKTGVPSAKDIKWDPVVKDGNLKYLLIKSPDELAMNTTDGLGAYTFWNSLNLKYKIYDNV